LFGRALEVGFVEGDLANVEPLVAEPLKVSPLVGEPLVEEQLRLLAGLRRPLDLPASRSERKRGQVFTGEVRGEVARRELDAVVDRLHPSSIASPARATDATYSP